ncbi:hypothetical protein [Rubrobacter naiadicus]|nr:hypothetical protein [Rubrobacter naiadicus]
MPSHRLVRPPPEQAAGGEALREDLPGGREKNDGACIAGHG